MDSFYPNPAPHLSEIIVETTTACNIKCIHCAVSNEGYAIKTLRYESFENIVSIMKTYKPLVKLNGHGETLLHKRFFDMLDVTISAGCKVVFQTNATLLVPEVSRRLLHYAGPDKLMAISISSMGWVRCSTRSAGRPIGMSMCTTSRPFGTLGPHRRVHILILTSSSRRCC